MRAYTLVFFVLFLWTQESYCKSRAELSVQEFDDFVFNFEPPVRDPPAKIGSGDLNVTTNVVPGFDDFWNDKMIQVVNQIEDIQKYTIPAYQDQIDGTYNFTRRLYEGNDYELSNTRVTLTEACTNFKVALDILVNVKNVPTYNNTIDHITHWVEDALKEIAKILPKLLQGTDVLQSDTQKDLDYLKVTLKTFTADKLRRQCYPNVRCVSMRLTQLKDLIAKTRDKVQFLVKKFSNIDTSYNTLLRSAKFMQGQIVSDLCTEEGNKMLDKFNVTIAEINSYFIRYHIAQNEYSLFVQSQINRTYSCIYELDFRNVRCRNLTRNAIVVSGYPIYDVVGVINMFGRNRNQRSYTNESDVVYAKVTKLQAEMNPKMPNFQTSIAQYFAQVNKQNESFYTRTAQYINEVLYVGFGDDRLEWYLFLLEATKQTDATVLDVISKETEYTLKNCTATVKIATDKYNKWIGGTLPSRITTFHETELEPMANGIYSRGNITHYEIFYFGTLNWNSTYRTWKPKLDVAITNCKAVYDAIIAKNYTNYSIYPALAEIFFSLVSPAFEKLKDYYDQAEVGKLNATAFHQLVTIPSEEYVRLTRDTLKVIKESHERSLQYNGEAARIRANLDAIIKNGTQDYSYHRAPKVEHSHVNNDRNYGIKVEFMQFIDKVTFISMDMTADDQNLDFYAEKLKKKFGDICNDYAGVIYKFYEAKVKGIVYMNKVPSAFPSISKMFREWHLNVDSLDPTAKIIDLFVI